MDRALVRHAALLVLVACACARNSSKDDHAPPTATGRLEMPTPVAQGTASGSAAPPTVAAPAKPRAAIRIDSVAGARAAIGKLVHVEGSGDNAKLGAVVVTGDLVVYCSNHKDGWDERNVPVVVEGVIDYTSQAKTRIGSNGSISAGTGEPIFQMTCDLVR